MAWSKPVRKSSMKLNVKFTIIILIFVFVPVAIFSMAFFHNIEHNTIQAGYKALEYSLNRAGDEIVKNVDNVNMSTQFFLSDKSLMEYLRKIDKGKEISYEEMMDFYNMNISSLERIVNTNPSIYQIRVYVDSSTMEEMMPILYRYDRMNRLAWAKDEDLSGWKFDYPDTTFDTYTTNKDNKLAALVTPIADYNGNPLGVLEVAIGMDALFPSVYAREEGSVCFFIDEQGRLYSRAENRDFARQYCKQYDMALTSETDNLVMDYHSWQGTPVVAGSLYVKELNGTFVCVSSLESGLGVIRRNRNIFLFVLIVIFFIMIGLINFVVKRLLSQFYQILQSIREVQKGNLNIVIENCGNDEMGELGNQINKMMERIRQLMEDNLNRELLIKNSEIRALQNQINAHFIYNVLESIKMMAEIDERYDISDAITALGKLLRYSMRWVSGNVTVGEELEYVRNYLALINLRFDYEIHLALKMPDMVLRQEIPKMSLQPIVENAIQHGIEQLAEDTSIYVKGWLKDGDCIIEITDFGRGMNEEELSRLYRKINGEIEAGGGSGNGIGLKNVQDRIKISFGEKYGIHISSKEGCYTKVQVTVPQTYFGAKQSAEETEDSDVGKAQV